MGGFELTGMLGSESSRLAVVSTPVLQAASSGWCCCTAPRGDVMRAQGAVPAGEQLWQRHRVLQVRGCFPWLLQPESYKYLGYRYFSHVRVVSPYFRP